MVTGAFFVSAGTESLVPDEKIRADYCLAGFNEKPETRGC